MEGLPIALHTRQYSTICTSTWPTFHTIAGSALALQLQDGIQVAACEGMLRVALDRQSQLVLCAVDVLPFIHEEHAEVAVRIGKLRVALDRRPVLALCAMDVLSVLYEE
jgi:hypothetical protein